MTPKIQARGASFKGLATYLMHDPKAATAERVDWTHTLNLANDHIASAVDEMLWTARYAEVLKQQAGIRAGGRTTEKTVKHFSLNWSPEDDPSREHMIETTEKFLRHMGWHEHQAVLVAHNDKEYCHVHAMLNAIHLETGLRLDEGFEQRRAQAWALEYEKEQGRIYCEQRLKNANEREDSPSRNAWLSFQDAQKSFERDEENRRNSGPELSRAPDKPENVNASEWKALKELQRSERQDYFADGKSDFRDLRRGINREVRDEFRPHWAEYYEAEKNGADADTLKEMKATLIGEQKSVLEERRDIACEALREARDVRYRELLDAQAEMRHALHGRQDAGLSSVNLLDKFASGHTGHTNDLMLAFQEAARETTVGPDNRGLITEEREEVTMGHTISEDGNMRAASSVGLGVTMGLGFFFDYLADGLVHSKPAPKPRRAEPEMPRSNLFENAAEDARKNAARENKELEDRRNYEEQMARTRD
jgi:hypothetical protein